MLNFLRKVQPEQALPSFSRYYTTRKPWLTDEDVYDCPFQPTRIDLYTPIHTFDPYQPREEICDDPEQHIYEEIDDVIPIYTIQKYIDEITSLTVQIETDFGQTTYSQVKPKCSKVIPNIVEDSIHNTTACNSNSQTSPESTKQLDIADASSIETHEPFNNNDIEETKETVHSPTTLSSREKCKQWLSDQAAHWSKGAFPPITLSPVFPICDDPIDDKSSRKLKRCNKTNVCKMSSEKRQALLKRIEETWLDSSDDCSDCSEDSSIDGDVTSSICHVARCVNNLKNSVRSLTSSSGYYEDKTDVTSESHTTSQSTISNDNGKSECDSVLSDDTYHGRKLPFFKPKFGFGLNRWFKQCT